MAETVFMRRRKQGFTTLGLVLALSAIGVGSLLFMPLITEPPGPHVRRVLVGLATGTFGFDGWDLVGLVRFAARAFLPPLLVMAAFVAIEQWTDPRVKLRKRRALIWLVQAVFIGSMTVFSLVWGRYGFNPKPLIQLPAGSAFSLLLPAFLYLALLLIHDVILYWVHRAQHRVPALWRIHAIHHAEELSVLHNIVHPLEQAFIFLFILIPTAWVVNVSQGDILFLAAFFTLQGPFIHSRLPLHFGRFGLILNDNRHHYIHHDRHQERAFNFAARFPVIDLLFGTYKKPEGEMLPETGLADKLPPASLGGYIFARLGSAETRHKPHRGIVPQ